MIYSFISTSTIILFKILRTLKFLYMLKFAAYKLKVLYHDHACASSRTASLCTYYVRNLYGLSLYQLSTPNSNDTLAVTIKMKSKKIFARSPSFYFTIHKNILISKPVVPNINIRRKSSLEIHFIYLGNKKIYRIFKVCYIISVYFLQRSFTS